MALEGCYSCIKYLMFAFNFLFWILGCVILGIGIWVKVDPQSFADASKDSDAVTKFLTELSSYKHEALGAYILIGVGSAIMIIGFLGCCGAIRESQCMLVLFFIFLSIIFVALLIVGVYLIINKDNLKQEVSKQLKAQIERVKQDDKAAEELMGALQQKFQCCGNELGPLDYGTSGKANCPSLGATIQPCAPVIYNALTKNLIVIGGVAIGIGAVMLLGMIFSMLLCCAIRENM